MKIENDLKGIYLQAKTFLLKKIPAQNPDVVLARYLSRTDASKQPMSIEDVYCRLLMSAQNANMRANVIGGSIGGVRNLGAVLFGFDPKKVKSAYGNGYDALFHRVRSELKPNGKLRDGGNSLWPKYCRTALSAADFLSQFEDGKDFYQWAGHFYGDVRSMPALPLVLSQEVFGMGYPLACDFFKELGFVDYGKPDVHIRRIFAGLGLVDEDVRDYQVQKIIARIAEDAGVSAYSVDKLFWLIGSGKFYDDTHLGKGGLIGRMGPEFIDAYVSGLI